MLLIFESLSMKSGIKMQNNVYSKNKSNKALCFQLKTLFQTCRVSGLGLSPDTYPVTYILRHLEDIFETVLMTHLHPFTLSPPLNVNLGNKVHSV